MSRFRSLVLLALVPVALGVIGGPLAAAADESSKPPAQILADVQRDLAKVRSYHFSGTEVDGRSTVRLAGDVSASGKADVTLREGAASARVILLPSTMYLKANAAFWKANGGSEGSKLADKLAGRWFKANDPSLKELIDDLLPKHVASCVTVGTGTLRNGGVSSVGGKRAVVVVAAGDKPGSTPGRLYVTTSPPILPLRLVQTGKRKSGGHLDKRCQDSSDTSSAGDVRFSAFDKALHIRAPRGAITIPDAGGDATPAASRSRRPPGRRPAHG
jgi:hypothetical protein